MYQHDVSVPGESIQTLDVLNPSTRSVGAGAIVSVSIGHEAYIGGTTANDQNLRASHSIR